jgi:hypothetical protein
LIGTGVMAQKRYKFSSKIKSIDITWATSGSQNGGGSKIFGVEILELKITDLPNTNGIQNVLIQRNKIGSLRVGYIYSQGCGDPCSVSTQASNININNNIITSCAIYGKSIYVKNNIIESVGGGFSKYISNLVVAHNLIFGSCNLDRGFVFNNIFFSSGSKVFEGCEYTSITRNLISGKVSYTNADVVFGTNSGGENILNEDPMFFNANTSPRFYDYTSNGPFADYHLSAGSPAIGAGIGGVDLGIYGGDSPFFEGEITSGLNRYFPMPAIPVMLDMNIVNSSLLKTSKLKVEFKARKQD